MASTSTSASNAALRKRTTDMATLPDGLGASKDTIGTHPAGEVKHGMVLQVVRGLLLVTYFLSGCMKYASAFPLIYISLLTGRIASL